MKEVKEFEATEFNNIKEIIYNSAKKYSDQVSFVIKKQKDKDIKYINITYKKLLIVWEQLFLAWG